MQIGTDQTPALSQLSATGQTLLGMGPAILDEWAQRVRAQVRGTATLEQPLLINTLPVLLENIAEAISARHPRTLATSGSSIAVAHGNERARMTDYQPQDLVREFQLFRETLFEVSERGKLVLDRQERVIINASIDAAVVESISAYATAQAAFRTKYIAALAHDLRTPLSVILSALSMLDEHADAARITMLAAAIRKNVDRADQMLRDMLDTASLQGSERLPIQPEAMEMLELVQDVVRDAPLHPGGYAVEGPAVRGTWCPVSLRRALENLIRNAVKYGRRETPITVAIKPVDDQVLLSVHNMGKPIPADQIAEHFLMFRRGGGQGKVTGWGIGLAFVKNVADSHGGSLNIDSTEERGTTVMMDLPLQPLPARH